MGNQSTHVVFMVRPAAFGYNPQTAGSNSFQAETKEKAVHKRALAEFDEAVSALRESGITVFVFQDSEIPVKPDAVFPNNWVSLHADGTCVIYPMLAENRRIEVNRSFLTTLEQRFNLTRTIDLSSEALNHQFLEGTGSLVFDHINKVAFACLSPRTSKNLATKLCSTLGYSLVFFEAKDAHGVPIYHTNVLMAIGDACAVCCFEVIDEKDQLRVEKALSKNNRAIITITLKQMEAFAGNMLALRNTANEAVIAISNTAFNALTAAQKSTLAANGHLLILRIPTIERVGGGSVRCMLAEIFLPQKTEHHF